MPFMVSAWLFSAKPLMKLSRKEFAMASPVAMEMPMVMEGRVVVRRRAKDASQLCFWSQTNVEKRNRPRAFSSVSEWPAKTVASRAGAAAMGLKAVFLDFDDTLCATSEHDVLALEAGDRRRRVGGSPSAGPSPPVPSIARACSRTSGRCSRARRGTRPRPGGGGRLARRAVGARARAAGPLPRRRARRRGGRRRRRRRADRVRRPQAGAPRVRAGRRARGYGGRTRARGVWRWW